MKTYAAASIIASGLLFTAINAQNGNSFNLHSTPFKPEVLNETSGIGLHTSGELNNIRMFLAGDGRAEVFSNPFAKNESLTLVHSDKFKTLADLNDPSKWAANVAVATQINNLFHQLRSQAMTLIGINPLFLYQERCYQL